MRKKYQESLASQKRKLDFDNNDSDVTEIFPKKVDDRSWLVMNWIVSYKNACMFLEKTTRLLIRKLLLQRERV